MAAKVKFSETETKLLKELTKIVSQGLGFNSTESRMEIKIGSHLWWVDMNTALEVNQLFTKIRNL